MEWYKLSVYEITFTDKRVSESGFDMVSIEGEIQLLSFGHGASLAKCMKVIDRFRYGRKTCPFLTEPSESKDLSFTEPEKAEGALA